MNQLLLFRMTINTRAEPIKSNSLLWSFMGKVVPRPPSPPHTSPQRLLHATQHWAINPGDPAIQPASFPATDDTWEVEEMIELDSYGLGGCFLNLFPLLCQMGGSVGFPSPMEGEG